MKTCELALSLADPGQLAALAGDGALRLPEVLAFAADPAIAALLEPCAADRALSHLYFGSEFCEHLLPDAAELAQAVHLAQQRELQLVLLTPVANDALLARLSTLLPGLPADSAVLVNDWGVAHYVHSRFPEISLIAGRQLSKMLKDPRLPGEQWADLYPSAFRASRQMRLLQSLAIERIELDVPPFARAEFFAVPEMKVGVHAPFAYIAKGRLCKVGSLSRPAALKFAPGGACHRECLGVLEIEDGVPRHSLRTAQRGTTMFYRHDAALLAVLATALQRGSIARLILSAP